MEVPVAVLFGLKQTKSQSMEPSMLVEPTAHGQVMPVAEAVEVVSCYRVYC